MKRTALISCLVISLVLITMGASFAGTVTQWEMIYDHDANGQVLNGTNINNLKNAVLNGSDVKVIFHGAVTHHSMKLTRVRVETTADGSSTASVTGFYDETSTTPSGYLANGLYDNTNGVVPRLYSYSTNGQMVSYWPQNVIQDNINVINVPMTWYVSK